jgi:hypothetical protein
VDVSKQHVLNAVEQKKGDFEDEVPIQTLIGHDIRTVITRNTKDFVRESLNVFTPTEYLESLRNAGAL